MDQSNDQNELAPKVLGLWFGVFVAMLIGIGLEINMLREREK
jgi:hypothetical protein